MDLRSVVGSLQLPVAALGAALIALAAVGIYTLPAPPPGSEGFVSGLATIALYVLGWAGVLVLSAGLAIAPGAGYGIEFNRYQRGLFLVAALAGLASAVGPFVAFGLLLSRPSLIGGAWLAIMGVAVLALTVGLVWRGACALRARWAG